MFTQVCTFKGQILWIVNEVKKDYHFFIRPKWIISWNNISAIENAIQDNYTKVFFSVKIKYKYYEELFFGKKNEEINKWLEQIQLQQKCQLWQMVNKKN